MDQKLWYNYSVKETIENFNSDETGLTNEQSEENLLKYGNKELPDEKKFVAFKIFLSQFNNVLIYILIAAAVISFLFHEYLDLIVISFAIFINVIVGFIQENKAEKALASLKSMVVHKAKVLRQGKLKLLNAEDLVAGDILILEAGDQVTADARLIKVNNLHVNEAILTGESTPVVKKIEILSKNKEDKVLVGEQKNMIFNGTLVTEGKATAVVVAIGIDTEMGQIAKMIERTKDTLTPLQKKLNLFSKKLGLAVLVLASIIVVIGLFRGFEFEAIFMVAVAVAVSAIPEGLLVSITVTLVIGMQRILKQKALVRKLVAAETLGSTTIVCVDKTGTLTEGTMKIEKIFSAQDEIDIKKKQKWKDLSDDMHKFVNYILLCNNAVIENPEETPEHWKLVGSPTEKAILGLVQAYDVNQDELIKSFPRSAEVPFDSFNKRMVTTHDLNKKEKLLIQKGAPEKIIKICTKIFSNGKEVKFSKSHIQGIEKNLKKLSEQGYRLLASCYKKQKLEDQDEINNDFVFMGYLAIRDPIRSEVKNTIKIAKQAGLRTIMITGDHALTAKAIAKEVGLKVNDENILTGVELDELTDDQLKKNINKYNVYARVTPAHKLKIVNAWKDSGEVVAMTGDGVNDAPALKAADIGISVGTGSDVTKATADMVLMESDFSVIIEAIKQGRLIFSNIKKVIVYLLADSFSEVILVAGALFLGLPLPITAAQILWINLITDGFPAAALTVEKGHGDVMKDKPQPRNNKVLDKEMKALIFIIGIITDVILLSVFYIMTNSGLFEIEYIRTVMFAALGIDSLLYVFSCKSLRHSVLSINIFDNKFLNVAVLMGVLLQLSALYVPFLQNTFDFSFLGLSAWGLILSLAFLKLFLIEFTKYFFVARKQKTTRLWRY